MFRSIYPNKSWSRWLTVIYYNISVLLTLVALCLSIFLVHKVTVLKYDLDQLKREFFSQYKQRPSPFFNHGQSVTGFQEKFRSGASTFSDEMKTERSHHYPIKTSSLRMKREQSNYRDHQSFLQLTAAASENPVQRGNVTSIPWNVAVRHGEAAASTNNTIIVQQDSYYMVFGQVLFHNPGTIMGYFIQRRKSSVSGREQRFTELLRCLQEMPPKNSANTCYTAGIVKLEREDELKLVILDRANAKIAMETDSTFFGIIRLR